VSGSGGGGGGGSDPLETVRLPRGPGGRYRFLGSKKWARPCGKPCDGYAAGRACPHPSLLPYLRPTRTPATSCVP